MCICAVCGSWEKVSCVDTCDLTVEFECNTVKNNKTKQKEKKGNCFSKWLKLPLGFYVFFLGRAKDVPTTQASKPMSKCLFYLFIKKVVSILSKIVY